MSMQVRRTRAAHWFLLAALGCSEERHAASNSSPVAPVPRGDGCSATRHVEVPLDLPAEQTDPPGEVPFGARFALVDSESVSLEKSAAVALVSWQGVDDEQRFALNELCPDGVCRNVHGTSVLGTSAGGLEFLLAEQGSAVSMPAYPLRLMVWDSAGSDAEITPLFAARVTAITTRTDMQASKDARRALFALGNIDTPELELVEIAENAALVAPPVSLTLGTPWDCLSVLPTDTAGAISAVTKLDSGTAVVWSLRELDADANVVFDTSVTVPVGDTLGYTDCPTVLAAPEGFLAEWTSTDERSVLASVPRDLAAGAGFSVLELDASPGLLEGVLHDELLFLAALDGGAPGFVRLTRTGEPGGPTITLPALPASTAEQRRAPPHVLNVKGASVDIAYELENTRVFEELSCP